MSVDRLLNVPTAPSGPVQLGRDREGLESLKAAELAREFESMLLLQMLRQMRQSMVDESTEDEGLSASTWLDTIDSELARQLSKAGGVGLADVMTRAIQRQTAGRIEPANTADTAPRAISGERAAQTSLATVPGVTTTPIDADRLTSNYGWRVDPFTGASRYHHGVDLKAAYGQGVPAAGQGQVVEAGDRGPYGLTVVVEHGNGLRTRYAHLSVLEVSAGDRVLQGQEIGRVGQTGRATGPHLHFEVIRNGQRIDPAMVMALQGSGLGGLKLAGAVADSPIGGLAHTPATTGVDDED